MWQSRCSSATASRTIRCQKRGLTTAWCRCTSPTISGLRKRPYVMASRRWSPLRRSRFCTCISSCTAWAASTASSGRANFSCTPKRIARRSKSAWRWIMTSRRSRPGSARARTISNWSSALASRKRESWSPARITTSLTRWALRASNTWASSRMRSPTASGRAATWRISPGRTSTALSSPLLRN